MLFFVIREAIFPKKESPSNEGLLILCIHWAKKERFQQFVKTLRYHSMRDGGLSTFCDYNRKVPLFRASQKSAKQPSKSSSMRAFARRLPTTKPLFLYNEPSNPTAKSP
jgi:hypothetical protein